MHTTLSITQLYKSPIRAKKTPYCQETPQPIDVLSYTTMEIYVLITMTQHFSNIFLVELWRSLVLSDLTYISRLISLHYVPTTLLFPFNNCTWKIVIQTHYITFQDINMEPYFEIACLKSVLSPTLISNVVNVSLSGGSLGYWTACNNFKRFCTLPYCGVVLLIYPYLIQNPPCLTK